MLPSTPDRAVTLVGDELAAIIHDPVLLDQPALLEAAGSAARFALENERLQAELRAQLAELRESRARIVRAGDEERRRLERDLHDGAQQRLLGLGMGLQLLQSHVDRAGGRLLEETEAELRQALAELRELARGIHPAVLTDQGLAAAIRTLASRAPLPVEVEGCSERFPGRSRPPPTSWSARRLPTSPNTPTPATPGSGSTARMAMLTSRSTTTASAAPIHRPARVSEGWPTALQRSTASSRSRAHKGAARRSRPRFHARRSSRRARTPGSEAPHPLPCVVGGGRRFGRPAVRRRGRASCPWRAADDGVGALSLSYRILVRGGAVDLGLADAANGPDHLRDRGGQLAGGSAGGLSGLAACLDARIARSECDRGWFLRLVVAGLPDREARGQPDAGRRGPQLGSGA